MLIVAPTYGEKGGLDLFVFQTMIRNCVKRIDPLRLYDMDGIAELCDSLYYVHVGSGTGQKEDLLNEVCSTCKSLLNILELHSLARILVFCSVRLLALLAAVHMNEAASALVECVLPAM